MYYFVHSLCNGNANTAAERCRRRFLQQIIPDGRIFVTIPRHFRESRPLPSVPSAAECPLGHTAKAEQHIIQMVRLSTISHAKTLHNEELQPYYNPQIKQFEPGDMGRRLEF
jgi:hypothetical protein